LELWAAAGAPVANTAARTLGTVLEGVRTSVEGERAWCSSALARDGFPLEFAFTSAGHELRYTTEVTGPEVAPGARLATAADLYRWLGGEPVPARLLERIAAVQGRGPLKYGAWLSGRHRGGESRFKLYAEIPAAAGPVLEAWEERRVGRPAVLTVREPRLVMIGCDARRLELYYRARGLRPGEVATLLGRVGLEGRAGELLELLELAYRRPVRRELPSVDFGWSYAFSDHGPETFTLYTFANSLFGGDGRIRRALLGLGERLGWDLSFYEALSRPLSERRGFPTRHGLFGLAIGPVGPPAVAFGLTPPEPLDSKGHTT
jgi:hypothetical protein